MVVLRGVFCQDQGVTLVDDGARQRLKYKQNSRKARDSEMINYFWLEAKKKQVRGKHFWEKLYFFQKIYCFYKILEEEFPVIFQ